MKKFLAFTFAVVFLVVSASSLVADAKPKKKTAEEPTVVAPAPGEATSSYDQPLNNMYGTPASEKPTSGYDGGFFVQTADGKYKLKMSARLDTMFYWQNRNVPDNPATITINEAANQYTFRIRRANISLDPVFNGNLTFKFSLTASSGDQATGSGADGGFNTSYFCYGNWAPSDYFDITFGQFDPEYDLQNSFSTKYFTMVDFPIIQTQQDGERPVWNDFQNDTTTIARPSMGLPTQLGISIGGYLVGKKFRWAAGFGNGTEGVESINRNHRFTYTVRLQYAILGDEQPGMMNDYPHSDTPQLNIGAGGAFESDKALNSTTGLAMYNWSLDGTADLAFRWKGLAVTGGAYYRQLKTGPGAIIERGEKYLTDFGYIADISMFAITKKLEFHVWGCQIMREGPDNNAYEFGGGANHYFAGPNAKFGVDFSPVFDYDDITGTNSGKYNRVRAKMQLFF